MPAENAPRMDPMTQVELNRLRWRCRRGMLENDLILSRFVDAHAATLTRDELGQLDQLLALADDELWDLLSGRVPPADVEIAPLVTALRAA
jgi:antitoxin CptB